MTLGAYGAGHVLVTPRYPVAKVINQLPVKYLEALEHNQKISSCCRHPENHDISVWKSSPSEPVPDIYKFHCTCGRTHVRFCVGFGDERPVIELDRESFNALASKMELSHEFQRTAID